MTEFEINSTFVFLMWIFLILEVMFLHAVIFLHTTNIFDDSSSNNYPPLEGLGNIKQVGQVDNFTTSDEYLEAYHYYAENEKVEKNNKIEKAPRKNLVKVTRDIPIKYHEIVTRIPVAFDAREKWPHCPSIGRIEDQSVCGSCWAIATTDMITDRICIHSGGTNNLQISAQDLLTCGSWYCSPSEDGCQGGSITQALRYWVEYGISTGGGYGTKNGCKSYSFETCVKYQNETENIKPICPNDTVHSPACVKSCDNGVLDLYKNTLNYGESIYRVASQARQIQEEILKNGPVLAVFVLHEDFLHYRHGIYRHLTGESVTFHAIKIIGWGVENGTSYWLVANSLNEEWGESGFFRILRGENECAIEQFVYGGIPKLNINSWSQ